MSETVFIAWGRNEAVAQAVSGELSVAGYSPVVGGIRPGNTPSTFFISSNVLSQIENSSAAIILVQKILSASGKRTSEFRPNLMFEWGYIQHAIRPESIHVFLINIQRNELPSDLTSAYTETFSLRNPDDPTEIYILAKEISKRFISRQSESDLDGLNIIRYYDYYRGIIWDIMQSKRTFSPKEGGYYLLNLFQPAFYRNDLDFIRKFLEYYAGKVSGSFTDIVVLLSDILAYYAITGSIANDPISIRTTQSKEYRELISISNSLQSIQSGVNRTFNILGLIRDNFIGLANMQAYSINGDIIYIDKSIYNFHEALDQCTKMRSVHQSNMGFLRLFWETYIERNLGRAYFLRGDIQSAAKHRSIAEQRRIQVRSYLRGSGVDYLANAIELEIGLSKFDEAIQRGAKETDLLEIVDNYLAPFRPRGADHVWDRLHAAVLKEADRQGLANVSTTLSKLK